MFQEKARKTMLSLSIRELKEVSDKLSEFPINKMPGMNPLIAFHPGENLRVTSILDQEGRLDIEFPSIPRSVDEFVAIDYTIFSNLTMAFFTTETITIGDGVLQVKNTDGKVLYTIGLIPGESAGFYNFSIKEPEGQHILFTEEIKLAIKDASRHVRDQPQLLSCIFIDASGNFITLSSTSYWARGIMDTTTTIPYMPLLTKLATKADYYVDQQQSSTTICGTNWRVSCRKYIGDPPRCPVTYSENLDIADSEDLVITKSSLSDILNKANLLLSGADLTITPTSEVIASDYLTTLDLPIETQGSLSSPKKTSIDAYESIFKESATAQIKLTYTQNGLIYQNDNTKTIYFFRLMRAQ